MEDFGEDFEMPVVRGVSGSFDVVAARARRAPDWIQNIGMEWFYRFIQEPGRLWKRYLLANSYFAWLVLKEIMKRSEV